MQLLLDKLKTLLSEDSINFSEHVLPLVSALKEACRSTDDNPLQPIFFYADKLQQLLNIQQLKAALNAINNDYKTCLNALKTIPQNLDLDYAKIETGYLDFNSDLTLAQIRCQHIDAQYQRVLDVQSTLLQKQSEHQRVNATQLIQQKQQQFKSLQTMLANDFSIIINHASRDEIPALIKSINKDEAIALDFIDQLRHAKSCLHALSSQHQALMQLDDLSKEEDAARTRQEKILSDLSAIDLPEGMKVLYKAMHSRTDIEQTLKEKQNSVYSWSSYLWPSAWAEWREDKQFYYEKQPMLAKELDYLRLLFEKCQIEETLNLQQQRVRRLQEKAAGHSLFQTKSELKKEQRKALQMLISIEKILPDFPSSILEDSDENCIQRQVDNCIYWLQAKAGNKKEAARILRYAQTLGTEINELQLKNSLSDIADENPLTDHVLPQARVKQILAQCAQFTQRYLQYNQKVKEASELKNQRRQIKKRLSATPTYTGKLSLAISKAEQSLTEAILHASLPMEEEKKMDEINVVDVIAVPKSPRMDKIQLNALHEQILSQTIYQDSPYAPWYQDVYKALELIETETQYHQACQLLRDISFEFDYCKTADKKLQVLEYYQKMCPRPADDLFKLLSLKPAIPLDVQDESQLRNQGIYQSLLALREKSRVLDMEGYRKEARLLSQARQSLYQYALSAEKGSARKQLPAQGLLSDPRYDPIKYHRGILQIWEALEQLIGGLLNKLFDRPLPQKPFCFFKTTSQQLLENAEQKVLNLAPEPPVQFS